MADALTERGDDFNLLVAGKDIHGGPNPACWEMGRVLENLSLNRAILREAVIFLGAQSRGCDPGPGCFQQRGPT